MTTNRPVDSGAPGAPESAGPALSPDAPTPVGASALHALAPEASASEADGSPLSHVPPATRLDEEPVPDDIVVIGVGNPFRRDDGVGPAVAERLRAQHMPGVRLEVSDGDAASLIDLWDGARLAVLIDAVRTDPPTPGRVHRLVVVSPPTELGRTASSHAMDLGEAFELAKVLGRLPRRLVLFAVEAGDVGFGPGLTPAVAAAAGRVAAEIVTEVAAIR